MVYSFTVDGREYRNFDLDNPDVEQELRLKLGDAKVDEILANKEQYKVRSKEEILQEQIDTLSLQLLDLMGV